MAMMMANGGASSRAQWVKDIENGALVTLDFKCSAEEFERRKALSVVHGVEHRRDPPLTSVYLSPEICKELGSKAAMHLGGMKMTIPVHTEMCRTNAYTHVVVEACMCKDAQSSRLRVSILFQPGLRADCVVGEEEKEEGEITAADAEDDAPLPTILKHFDVVMRMWSSYITEDHGEVCLSLPFLYCSACIRRELTFSTAGAGHVRTRNAQGGWQHCLVGLPATALHQHDTAGNSLQLDRGTVHSCAQEHAFGGMCMFCTRRRGVKQEEESLIIFCAGFA